MATCLTFSAPYEDCDDRDKDRRGMKEILLIFCRVLDYRLAWIVLFIL